MAGTFDERISRLIQRTGSTTLVGSVIVDQQYAQYQHETLGLRHEPGRVPRYLGGPIVANSARYMQGVADALLEGDIETAMFRQMVHLASEVERLAPIDYNDLPRSAAVRVLRGRREVVSRAPKQRRLTEQELAQKRAGRRERRR